MEQEKENNVAVANNNQNMRWSHFALRLLAFANTFAAAVILGTDKQTKVVALQVIQSLPAINIPVTAKWQYMSAFVYFVVVNAIACVYAAVSLVMMLANRGHNNKSGRMTSLMLIVLDMLMVALLFSGGGAAFAVGLLGFKGNSHLQWNKVCDVFGRFCSQVGGAITVSLVGGALFLLLVLLSTLKLHNKHH